MIIRRVKGGRVHYAVAVDNSGCITEFSERKEQAVECDETLVRKVSEHYAERTRDGQPCGQISLVNVTGRPRVGIAKPDGALQVGREFDAPVGAGGRSEA